MPQRYKRYLSFLVLSLAATQLASCGSGGGTSVTPDFAVSVSPSTLTVVAGSTTTFQLSAQALNGFTGNVTVNVSGLPSGVTTTPSTPITLSSSTPQTVTVNCAANVPVANFALQFTGTSGSLSHADSVTLAVVVPTFTLSVSPSTLSLTAGGQAEFQVSLQPLYGFTGPAQVQIGGLPSNATLTPGSTFPVTAGSPQTVTVATNTLLGSSSYPLTITGTSGSIVVSATETLNVQNLSPPPSRAGFVQTDDTPGGGAYDEKHQRVYVSNPVAGTVDVISSTTYQILRRIPVPSPQGVDISPDDSTVFIGSGSEEFPGSGPQAVYALDTASTALTARYPGPPFGSTEFYYPESPLNPIAAPNGSALISINGSVVEWNPSTGQATTVLSSSPIDMSVSSPFSNTPYLIAAHSSDHSKLIVSNDDEPGTVWLYDTNQNAFLTTATFQGYAYSVAANPNGTQFAVAVSGYSQNIYILDANLNTIATVPGGGSLIYSLDGSELFVVGVFGENGLIPAVSILNSSTQQWVGTAPSFAEDIAEQSPPTDYESPMAVDETGRIFGSALNGLAIDDTTDLRTYTGTEVFPDLLFEAAPDDAPLGQQQTVALETTPFSEAPSIWFGQLPAQNTAMASYLTTTAPASEQVGTVNILVDTSQGVQLWLPQAYTYGAALAAGPDVAASNNGGTTIDLYGYGLGYNAPILGGSTGGATTATFGTYPGIVTSATRDNGFALWAVKVQTPSMPLGEFNLTASYDSSSSNLSSAYHAVSINSYPLDGTPYSIAYDAGRNCVYVAVTDHVDVFSLSSNAFVSTIQIPTVNNLKQLGGMALTPDGKWLIVANWADASVAVIDPDNPTGATAIAVGVTTAINFSDEPVGPFQIAPTDNSQAYISVSTAPQSLKNFARTGIGSPALKSTVSIAAGPQAAPVTEPSTWLLNLQTMTVNSVTSNGFVPGGYFMAASPDGSVICSANPPNGPTTLFTVATGTTVVGPISDNQGADDCAVNGGVVVSATQNSISTPIVSDISMRTISRAGMINYQLLDLLGSGEDIPLGIAADGTGALMYAPWGQEIALFDTHTGEYRERIALPALSEELTAGSLLIDQTGKQIFLVSQSGFTVIQLDSLPLAIGSIAALGATWTVAGTGFVPGTTLAVDGASQSAAYTDAQHLTVSGAPALSGVHTVTITNPDGHAYTYDAAYLR